MEWTCQRCCSNLALCDVLKTLVLVILLTYCVCTAIGRDHTIVGGKVIGSALTGVSQRSLVLYV